MDTGQMDAKVLGQLLLMQSVLPNLPDRASIFDFVCHGLTDIPGIASVRYESEARYALESSMIVMSVKVGTFDYGVLVITLSDKPAFEVYKPYLENFLFTIGVILELRFSNEAKFRAAFESSQDNILIWDKEYNYLYANQAALNHVGTTADKVIGMNIRDGLSHLPDFMKLWMGRIDTVIATGKPLKVYDETEMQGKFYCTDSLLTPIVRSDGTVESVCLVYRDVTDIKESERKLKNAIADKEILLRELYHRTKNNMHVINSMIALRAVQLHDKEAARVFMEMQHRIEAMALVHQKLYHSKNLSRIDMQDYIRELTSYLMDTHKDVCTNVQLDLDVENVLMVLDAAIPCGLIINELFSNAFKHAFKNRTQGMIRVILKRSNDGGIEFVVQDNGVGMEENVVLAQRQTLGLRTVVMIGEHQLQGTVVFETKNGVTCRIHFDDRVFETRV